MPSPLVDAAGKGGKAPGPGAPGGDGGDGQPPAAGEEGEGQELAPIDPEQQVGGLRPEVVVTCAVAEWQQGGSSRRAAVQRRSCCAVSLHLVTRDAAPPSRCSLQKLMAAFAAAAEAVKEKAMPVEERIEKWLRIWMKACGAGGGVGWVVRGVGCTQEAGGFCRRWLLV